MKHTTTISREKYIEGLNARINKAEKWLRDWEHRQEIRLIKKTKLFSNKAKYCPCQIEEIIETLSYESMAYDLREYRLRENINLRDKVLANQDTGDITVPIDFLG
jgi:hypothetical protein